jgi:hypothetical protein
MCRKTGKSGFICGRDKRVCSSQKRQTGFVAHSASRLLCTGVPSRRTPEADALLHAVPDPKIRVATTQLMLNGDKFTFHFTFNIDLPTCMIYLDDWLTVHHSITLVDFQLDAQNSYLFIYNTFIKILYMFRTLPCSSSTGLRLVSSLSAGDCPVHLLRKNRCTGQSPADSDDTRGCIYTVTT